MAKQNNTAMLDVGAMYTIGAAGANKSTQGQDTKALGLLSDIGRLAIGFKIQSMENIKQANVTDNTALGQVEDAMILHSEQLQEDALGQITRIKADLVDANKTMYGIKYSWRPNSKEYKEAENKRTNALKELKDLNRKSQNFSDEYTKAFEIVNGMKYTKADRDGNSSMYRLYGTSLEMLNSSLLASGALAEAREWDSDKNEWVINIGNVDVDPNKEGIQTDPKLTAFAESVNQEAGNLKVPFSSFQFARENNPLITDPGKKYIDAFLIEARKGTKGELTENTRARLLTELRTDLRRFGNRDFAQLIEEETTIIFGEEMSYLDAIVMGEISINEIGNKDDDLDDNVLNPNFDSSSKWQEGNDGMYYDANGNPELISEKELYELAIIGTKEVIKEQIINASNDDEFVKDYKKRVEEIIKADVEVVYEEELEQAIKRETDAENKRNRPDFSAEESELKKIKKIYDKVTADPSTSGTYVSGGVTYNFSGGKWSGGGQNKSTFTMKEFVSKVLGQKFYNHVESRKTRSRYDWIF